MRTKWDDAVAVRGCMKLAAFENIDPMQAVGQHTPSISKSRGVLDALTLFRNRKVKLA